MTLAVSRRRLLVGALGATGLALVAACGGSAAPTAAPVKTEPKPAAEPTKPAAGAAPTTASTGAAPTKPADAAAKPADAAAKPAAGATPQTNVQAGVSGGTPTAPTPTIPA